MPETFDLLLEDPDGDPYPEAVQALVRAVGTPGARGLHVLIADACEAVAYAAYEDGYEDGDSGAGNMNPHRALEPRKADRDG